MPKPIRVISLDFDGCMFNEYYLGDEAKDIIAANINLFTAFQEASVNYQKTVTFIGSNRQSLLDDMSNARQGKGSCYPAIRQISDFIGASFDNFLMADLYSKNEPGTAYTEAMSILNGERDYEKGAKSEYEWLHDTGKLSILVAQMHKIAGENPKEQIEYEFFDDREEILHGLRDFFQKNRSFIPGNVNLKLSRYTGVPLNPDPTYREGLVENILNIQGKGFVFYDYISFVLSIADLGIKNTAGTDDACINLLRGTPVRCLDDYEGKYDGATINLVKHIQLPTLGLAEAAEVTETTASEKASWLSRHKFKIAMTAAAIVGAGVGIALVATGVFAPLGVGLLGTTAMAAAAIGAGSALITGAALQGVEKYSELMYEFAVAVGDIYEDSAAEDNVGELRQSSYASMAADLPAAPAPSPALSPASSPLQQRRDERDSRDTPLWNRPSNDSRSTPEYDAQLTPEHDLSRARIDWS